ncbi:hypothetical protein ACOYX7_02690 [Enterococcus casseliflavus]
MEDYNCPMCGEELKIWSGNLLDCPGCGNMWAKGILDEMSEEQEEGDE